MAASKLRQGTAEPSQPPAEILHCPEAVALATHDTCFIWLDITPYSLER